MSRRVTAVVPATKGTRLRCWLFGHRMSRTPGEATFLYSPDGKHLLNMLCERCGQPFPRKPWFGAVCEYGTPACLVIALAAACAGNWSAAAAAVFAGFACVEAGRP